MLGLTTVSRQLTTTTYPLVSMYALSETSNQPTLFLSP